MPVSDKASWYQSHNQPALIAQAKIPQSSIDSILRGLTDRPNVESTLILSRKDGSIIKTAGILCAEQKRRARSVATYAPGDPTRMDSNGETSNSTGAEDGIVGDEEHTMPLPAEVLARSVFQFVETATLLGTTLCSVASQEKDDGASFLRSQQGDSLGSNSSKIALDDSEDLQDESQVQLMRLRIKSREIIIFPDPQYLCCVVQRIGKQGTGVNGR